MITIYRFFVTTGITAFLSVAAFFILTEGIRPEHGGIDPVSFALVFSARLALVLLNIFIIVLAIMRVDVGKEINSKGAS